MKSVRRRPAAAAVAVMLRRPVVLAAVAVLVVFSILSIFGSQHSLPVYLRQNLTKSRRQNLTKSECKNAVYDALAKHLDWIGTTETLAMTLPILDERVTNTTLEKGKIINAVKAEHKNILWSDLTEEGKQSVLDMTAHDLDMWDRCQAEYKLSIWQEARQDLDDVIGNGARNGADTELTPLIATRHPQRVFELPYEEQKGSWIGNHWLPPSGWRYFSNHELRTVYKDKSVMWVGDSLARRGALTMYGILKEAELNVPVAAIDASNIIDVNKSGLKGTWEPCTKWTGSTHQPSVCRTMPGGVGDYVYIVKHMFRELGSFFADEVSGRSNITENFDTIIIGVGNWDNKKPKPKTKGKKAQTQNKGKYKKPKPKTKGNTTMAIDLTMAIDMLGKLQSTGKTIIWRTSGFSDDKGASDEFYFEVNKRVLDQINSIGIRLQQENNTVSNLTCINWPGAIYPRSFGRERIKGDSSDHYGLEARLVLIQMITNHLASRQGLEF
jgi:hypothetical protein